MDIVSAGETDVGPVFDAWMGLPARQCAQVHSDFEMVNALADEPGVQTILEEGQYHGLDLARAMEPFRGFHDKVLWAFLEHPKVVEVAYRFREADEFPLSYWVRRREGVPVVEARAGNQAAPDLPRAIGSYFRLKEGRGRECVVDVYRRGTRLYYYAFPEDYAQASLEYVGDEKNLRRRSRRPVFQVVFVYDSAAGALDTYFRGGRRARQDLEAIFARIVLGRELEPARDERVYDLNRFKSPGVRFVSDPSSGIRDVRVKLLRLSLLGDGHRRVVLECDPTEDSDGVYKLLDEVFTRGGEGSGERLPLALANVTRVGLRATFAPGCRGANTRTFYLTYPSGCSLGHSGRDAALREMLASSGIEIPRAAGEP